jgi:galactose mutarotase-like enzyme
MMGSREVTKNQNWAGAGWSTSMIDPRQFVPNVGTGDSAHPGVLHGLRDSELSISALREWTLPMSENAHYCDERACLFLFTCMQYGNRIAKAQFALEGHEYKLAINDGPNALHGGLKGFDKMVWTVAKAELTPQGPQLTLTYLSKHGEEAYPGNLSVIAMYTLTDNNALRLQYSATTDKVTVVNLTQHSYFNLRGPEVGRDILGHIVRINADRFTPVDSTLIPSLPASTFEKSKISLIIVSSALPLSRIVITKSVCCRSNGVSSSKSAIPMTPFIGVRIS